jgi:uncharacterized Zn-finger protein
VGSTISVENEKNISLEKLIYKKKSSNTLMRQTKTNKTRKIYNCILTGCKKWYYSSYRLNIHLRAHEGTKPFSCGVCKQTFNEKGNLKIHLLIHSGEKPYNCTVFKCKKIFRTLGHLKDHMTTHYDLRFFKCSVCGLSFSRNWTLKKHKYTHTGEKPFNCDFCNKRFADKSNLTTHIKKKHKNDQLRNVDTSSSVNSYNTLVSSKENLSFMSAPNFPNNSGLDDYESSHYDSQSSLNNSFAEVRLIDENDLAFKPSCFRPSSFNNFNDHNNSMLADNIEVFNITDYPDFKFIDFEKDNLDADKILLELFMDN